LHPERESAESLAGTRRAISELSFASQYQQNPTTPERLRAIEAERERRFSVAYRSGDHLTLGRLWHNEWTGVPEDQITDDQAMASYRKFEAIRESLEHEFNCDAFLCLLIRPLMGPIQTLLHLGSPRQAP
jgi:hypothetical protein